MLTAYFLMSCVLGTHYYFECVRSGKARATHSKKLGQPCLARISANMSGEGKVAVQFVANHTGHEPHIKDCNLAPSVKEEVMRKVMAGIPRQRILEGMINDECLQIFA